jgi:hypothetical protein
MIYRILTGSYVNRYDREVHDFVLWQRPMAGAGATLGGVMWELHLPAPDFDNPRARFWFTERGWDRFGRAVVREGRRRGYVIKVIRRKNPRRSQIVYADEWQVALLPLNAARRDR